MCCNEVLHWSPTRTCMMKLFCEPRGELVSLSRGSPFASNRFHLLTFPSIRRLSCTRTDRLWLCPMTLSYRTESANMYKLENWSSNTRLNWMHHDCEIFAQLCKKTFTRVKKEWTSSVEVCKKLASRQKPGWSYEWVENEPNPFVPKFPRARQWTLKVRIVL